MKTAIDNYEIGKQKEVDADNFPYVVYGTNRFICPECKEAVSMVDGKNHRFFKHGNKSNAFIKECVRRAKSNLTISIADKLGASFYIRKEVNKHILTIGFKAIPETLIVKCERQGAYIRIYGISRIIQKFNINNINFSSNNTTYIPVDTVTSKNKIRIEYSSKEIEKLLKPYWSDHIDTTIGGDYGALFNAGDNGGKMIRPGDCITTYKSYIWLRPTGFLNYTGINFRNAGLFFFQNRSYTVYEGSFDVSVSNVIEFKNLADYLKRYLKVFLLEGETSITPIWPPNIRYDDGYRTNKITDMYYVVNTNNEAPTIFTYYGINPTPVSMKADKINNAYMGMARVDGNGKMINVERNVVSNGSYVMKISIGNMVKHSYLNERIKDNDYRFSSLKDIKLTFNSKIDCYLMDKKYNIIKRNFDDGNVFFEKDEKFDYLWLSCKNIIVAKLQRTHKKIKTEEYICDDDLMRVIMHSKHSSTIKINANLIKQVNYVIDNYKQCKNYFKIYKLNNNIPIPVAMAIRGNTNG